jgi:two-component system sensor histidine kinase DesK
MLIWLVFIAIPLVNAISSHDAGLVKALTIGASVAFVLVFVSAAAVEDRPLPDRRAFGAVAILLGIAVTLTLTDREGWATLFIYTVACIATSLRPRFSFPAVLVCSAACAGSLLAGGSSVATAVSYATPTLGIGMLMLVLADLRDRNAELHEARAELADLAVAKERERFARDLHDLLGHTLSVIALKAELAGRLLPSRSEQAAIEVAEIEQVARKALGEVRDAVSGYRRPTLDDELTGARIALSAAGIDATISRPEVKLDPEAEAVLAWTVREGATNVIRHSRARHCSVRVSASLDDAAIEVVDDGVGPSATNGDAGGHGLTGLAERARALDGRLVAGALADGGYRLSVTVPRAPA